MDDPQIYDIDVLRVMNTVNEYMLNNMILTDYNAASFIFNLPSDRMAYIISKLDHNDRLMMREILAEYKSFLHALYEPVLHEARLKFLEIYSNIKTTNTDFVLPEVLKYYRPGINPVTALYYELKMGHDVDVTDVRELILEAIAHDAVAMQDLILWYRKEKTELSADVRRIVREPPEIVFARKQLRNFEDYVSVFTDGEKSLDEIIDTYY